MNAQFTRVFAAGCILLALGLSPATAQDRGDKRLISLTTPGKLPGTQIAKDYFSQRAKAVAGKFGLPADKVADWLVIESSGSTLFGDSQTSTTSLWIGIFPPQGMKVPVPDVLAAILADSAEPLSDAYTKYERDLVRQHEADWQDMQKRHNAATQQASDLRAETTALSQRVTVDEPALRAAAAKLEDQKQQIDLDILSKTARRQEMEVQLAKQPAAIDQKVANDPIVLQLEKVVAAREAALADVKGLAKAGAATPKDESDVIANAAEAQARLLQRKHDAAIEAGGQALQAFNQELPTLAIDLRELQARQEFVKRKLDDLYVAIDLLAKLDKAETTASQTSKIADLPFDLPSDPNSVPHVRVDIAPAGTQ